MTTARTQLAAALRTALPTKWPVRAFPQEPDRVSSVLVLAYQTTIKPAPLAPVGHYEIGLKVVILASLDLAPDRRENVLEEALGRVLEVLDGATWLTWSDAERVTMLDHHAYEITATAVGEKTP